MEKKTFPPPAVENPSLSASPAVPKKILIAIRMAWIAAIFSGSITFLFVLTSLALNKPIQGIDVWSFLDILLLYGLAYGVYRKNRSCALILFIYFLLSKILSIKYLNGASIASSLFFLYCYAMGVYGTFTYHTYFKKTSLA